MTDIELLTEIKLGLGITGNFHDGTLQIHVNEAKAFMKSAGVPADVINSSMSVGCILRGVADLWNYGSGNGTLSNYFKMRALQLKKAKIDASKPEKLEPYFYEIEDAAIDYEAGEKYFEKYKPAIGACSAVANGNLIGRNYDWTYDEKAQFAIFTPAVNGRHAVVGVSTGTNDLTQDFVDSGKASDSYKILPFMLLDGVNDAGLFCEINVAPTGDKGITTGTHPNKKDLFAMMIPRYVLDYASTVDEAIALLNNRNIYCAYTDALKQEFHFLIKDKTKTVVIEFIENEMRIINTFVDNKPILTNLYLSDYDGTRESLTPYAMGIERQAILTSNYAMSNTEFGMISLMQMVWYTKAYAVDISPLWYSEFCGNYGDPYGDLTKDSPVEDYAPIMQAARALYARNIRDGKTWQTVHTAVYDIDAKKLVVIPQQTGTLLTFDLQTLMQKGCKNG